MQRCRKEQQAERGRMHDAGRDENPVRPVAIDQPSLDRGRARHGDEVGTHHSASECKRSGELAQVHQHRQRHHADRHARDQRDQEQPRDAGKPEKRDVMLQKALHRKRDT